MAMGTARIAGQVPVAKKAVIAGLLCAVAFAALSLLKNGEALASFAAERTSLETEQSLVETVVAEASGQAVPARDPDAQSVTALGQRLVQALPASSPYRAHYRFHVIDTGDINAFALPGGAIFVHRGLLAHLDRRPELLAAVLAHEMQHVERRHGLQNVYQSMTVSALTLWTFGLSSDFGSALTDTLINTRHSRKLEREADERALGLLTSAGFNPDAMPEALIRLATARQGWQPPAWLSTHPDPEDRASSLRQQLSTKVN